MITKRLRVTRKGNPPYIVPVPNEDPTLDLEPITRSLPGLQASIGNYTYVRNAADHPMNGTCITRSRVYAGFQLYINGASPYWEESQFVLYYYVTADMISSNQIVNLSVTFRRASPDSVLYLKTSVPSAFSGAGPVTHSSIQNESTTHAFTLESTGRTLGINKVSIFFETWDDFGLVTTPLGSSLSYDIPTVTSFTPSVLNWVFVRAQDMISFTPGDRAVELLQFGTDGRHTLIASGTDTGLPTTCVIPQVDLLQNHDFSPMHMVGGSFNLLNTLTDLTVNTKYGGPVNGSYNTYIGFRPVEKLWYNFSPTYGKGTIRYLRQSGGFAEYCGCFTFLLS